jgi:hypothetical protein
METTAWDADSTKTPRIFSLWMASRSLSGRFFGRSLAQMEEHLMFYWTRSGKWKAALWEARFVVEVYRLGKRSFR